MPNYRNRALLDLAEGAPCMVQFESCNHDCETTVAAHSNLSVHGKGAAIKAHDCFIAFACSSCHRELDSGPLSREEKEAAFRAAMDRTMLFLWEKGVIQVAGKQQREKRPEKLSKIVPRRM